jgi:hypothetical protein
LDQIFPINASKNEKVKKPDGKSYTYEDWENCFNELDVQYDEGDCQYIAFKEKKSID